MLIQWCNVFREEDKTRIIKGLWEFEACLDTGWETCRRLRHRPMAPLELELTGAEIRAVCVRAGISALRRSAEVVVLRDFMDSFCCDGGDGKEKKSGGGRFEWWEKFSRGSQG